MIQTSRSEAKIFYTATEACEILFGNSDKAKMTTMYRWLKDGHIKAERVGRTWLIPRHVLVEFNHGKDFV